MALPPVIRRARPLDEALPLEAPEDPAQVAGVEPQVAAERAGGETVAMGELVEDAGLGEGERAPDQSLVEDADPLGVEAIEAPDAGDAPLERTLGHGHLLKLPAMVEHVLDYVKYLHHRPPQAAGACRG